jgi:phenylacetate-CoA ligase
MYIKNFILEKLVLKVVDFLLGIKFMSKLIELRKVYSMQENKINELQENKLNSILRYAINNVPFYSDYKYLVNEKDIHMHLNKFPIIDKNILLDQQIKLLSVEKKNLIKCVSSGSTGQQSVIYMSKVDQSYVRATQILWWEWAGYKIGDPILQTGITPNRGLVKSIKDIFLNTYYLQAFTHSKDDVIKALKWAKTKNKPVLAGYASSLYIIAKYAIEEDISVDFKVAITWGDKLFDHYKKIIKQAFNVDIYETYGSAEGLMIGGQKDQEKMYQMLLNSYVEIVDDNDLPVKDGKMGHVIVTNLNAFAMPLIRYRIGDLAIKQPQLNQPLDKNIQLPLWEKIVGRDTDLVKTKSGKFLVVHSFTGIFEHIPEIKQFCVIQNNIEGIIINIIRGEGFNKKILNEIQQEILKHINEPFKIEFKEVDFSAPTKSGKPQLIISNLKK